MAIGAILEAHHSLLRITLELAVAAGLVVVFAVRQRRQPRPMLDPAVFASRPMAGVAALLLAVSVGYWAVLVYLPLFLGAGFGWTAEAAGLEMLAATLPMLVVPPFGGRLAFRLGWRQLFALALTLVAIGGCTLATATLPEPAMPALAWAFVGMTLSTQALLCLIRSSPGPCWRSRLWRSVAWRRPSLSPRGRPA